MSEDNYTKREQDHFFGDLFKRMDKQDTILERIETQTTKTNGRVTRVEDWSIEAKKIIESNTQMMEVYKVDKAYMKGMLKVVMSIAIVVPVVVGSVVGLYMYKRDKEIDIRIQNAVEQALLNRVNEVYYEQD